MTEADFERLNTASWTQQALTGAMLRNQQPRTLIYGYTVNRDTFHLYLEDGQLTLVVYDSCGLVLEKKHESEGITAAQCVPDKRVYPAACDLEFCELLVGKSVSIPFTTWQSDVKGGKTLSQLTTAYVPSDFVVEVPSDGFPNLALRDESEVRLARKATQDYIQGALRAELLEKEGNASASKWLANLPEGVVWSVSRERQMYAPNEPTYTLPAGAAESLGDYARRVLSERVTSVKSRNAA